jgi:hypothetical protein
MRPYKGISDIKLILLAPTCGDPISTIAQNIRCVHLQVNVITNIFLRIVVESVKRTSQDLHVLGSVSPIRHPSTVTFQRHDAYLYRFIRALHQQCTRSTLFPYPRYPPKCDYRTLRCLGFGVPACAPVQCVSGPIPEPCGGQCDLAMCERSRCCSGQD